MQTAGIFLKVFSLTGQVLLGRPIDTEHIDLGEWPVAGQDHVVGYW